MNFNGIQNRTTADDTYNYSSCPSGYNGGGQGHTHTLNDHTHSISATELTDNLPPYIALYIWKRIL